MRKAFGLLGILFFLIFVSCTWEYYQNGEILFLKAANIRNLMSRVGLFGILSLGQALVIVTGGIDLSVGSVVALMAISSGMMLKYGEGISPWIAIPLCLLVAAVIGLWHGILVAKVRLQPFVVTLCDEYFFS